MDPAPIARTESVLPKAESRPITGSIGANIEAVVMILGGVIYMASAHILIVITMSLVGSFMVAYALDTYILFPILAVVGGVIQFMMTHKRKNLVVIRKRFKDG